MSYADDVIRAALLTEVDGLKQQIPQTPATIRNLEAIEKKRPPEKMEHQMLKDYVNLLARSVP